MAASFPACELSAGGAIDYSCGQRNKFSWGRLRGPTAEARKVYSAGRGESKAAFSTQPSVAGVVESHPFAKNAKGWGTRRWFRDSHFRPNWEGAVESHPFAKCAKGWGTRRWFRDSHFRPNGEGAVECYVSQRRRDVGHPSVV